MLALVLEPSSFWNRWLFRGQPLLLEGPWLPSLSLSPVAVQLLDCCLRRRAMAGTASKLRKLYLHPPTPMYSLIPQILLPPRVWGSKLLCSLPHVQPKGCLAGEATGFQLSLSLRKSKKKSQL